MHPALVQALATLGIHRPTVVQAEAFRPLSSGRDTVLRAETGSGKTLAYLLPLANRIYRLHDLAREAARTDSNAVNPLQSSRPWVVLAPTSDLCAQILAMLEALDADRLVAAQTLTRLVRWRAPVRAAASPAPRGDAFREPMARERTTPLGLPAPLRRGGGGAGSGGGGPSGTAVAPAGAESPPYALASPRIRWGSTDIVVCTPAKFCEDLDQIREDGFYPACVVMDEADALFHGKARGYLFDIFSAMRPRLKIRQPDEARSRLPELPPAQFVFAAATMLHIGPFSVGNMIIERFCTAHTVETRRFHRLPSGLGFDNIRWRQGSGDWDNRVEQLLETLREVPCERSVVFVNSLHNCHVLLKFLRESGWPVTSFMKGPQGRMGPRFRDAQRFMEGEAGILVATEFGGRGIDWPDVDHVINFQMPTSAVCWLHRVGRTGRMGRRGLVTNFVSEKDASLADLIRSRLEVGKDLHAAFSRKRSLRKKMKAARAGGEEAEANGMVAAEDGTFRLHGGLELFEEGLLAAGGDTHAAGASSEEGTLLGYLPAAEPEPTATVSSVSQRRGAAGAAAAVAEEEDALAKFRRQLMESDSSGEEDEEEDGDEDEDVPSVGDRGGRVRSRAAGGDSSRRDFAWSMLEDPSGDRVFGPHSSRKLLNRGRPEHDAEQQQHRGRKPKFQQRLGVGGRKGLGVQAAGRAAAARNYAAPDDDLLL